MRRILLCIVSVLFFSIGNSQDQTKIKLKGVIMKNDYHENISWIKSKPIPLVRKDFTVNALDVKYIQIYFGLKVVDGKQTITPIRLVNNYKDQDWIFFDEVSYLLGSKKEVKYGKGKIFKIKDDNTRRNVNRGVAEYSDVIVNGDAKEFVKYIINNEGTGLNIRYTDTDKSIYREIKVPDGTKKLKKHFKALIEAYNTVNEAYLLNQAFEL